MAKRKKRTPLDETYERLMEWYGLTHHQLRDIHETIQNAHETHDCDDHKRALGDSEFECQLCGNSWEDL